MTTCGAVAKPQKASNSPFLCRILRLKATSRLKGDICGNPALQGGESLKKSIRLEDGPRLEEVTNLYGAGYESSVLQTAWPGMPPPL